MADTTISAAASLTASTVADGDLIPVLDISASAGSKASKITVAEMKARVLAVFPSDGHPYGFKDGAVVRLEDSTIFVPRFATNVNFLMGWSVTGDTPILTGTTVTFANPGSVTDIYVPGYSLNAGATLDFTGMTGLTSIGSYAFDSCVNLVGSLVLPDSLTSIGEHAFGYCPGLTGTLTIPSSVTTIGWGAFDGCTGFTSLTIPNSVTTISYTAFMDCSGFTGNLNIPSSVTTIGVYTFGYCSGFTSLTIGSGVTTIDDSAFRGCSGLTGSLTIPSSITSIGSYAFQNCSGLTGSLTIPSSITSIGSYAFQNCSGLTTVNAYVAKSVIDVTNSLTGTSVTSIHARSSDGTWSVGAGQTIGGKTGITVTKDL